MGRAKTKGNRTAGGKRKKATTIEGRESRVLPTPETNAYVERRLEYWTHPRIWNRASAEHCYDGAGVLWATGWLDGHGFGADELRNILRDYASLYWRWYPAPKTAKHERISRSEPSCHREKWEALFMKLDARLDRHAERKAVHELAVNGWYSDEIDHRACALANLGRLRINARLNIKLPIAGYIAADNGREMDWLGNALRGAFMLLDAKLPSRMTPIWALNDWDKQAA